MLLDAVAYTIPHMLLNTTTKDAREGVYIGIDVFFGRAIHWNAKLSPRHHILVVGPTGSGKTITLTAIASRLSNLFNVTLTVFDIKGEYASLLKLFTSDATVIWDVSQIPIPICSCNEADEDTAYNVNLFINTLNSLYKLPTYVRDQIREQLIKLCKYCYTTSLDDALRNYWIEETESIHTTLGAFSAGYTPSLPLHLLNQKNVVVDLSKLFLLDPKATATVVLYILKRIMRTLQNLNLGYITKVVLLDELWYIAQSAVEDFTNILIRYGRGYGVVLAMATQSIDDLNPYADTITENCGAVIALSSPSRGYWIRLSRYLNLSKKGIENALKLVGQGMAVARLYPYEKPFYIYIDPLT